jgi:hypothetical protein
MHALLGEQGSEGTRRREFHIKPLAIACELARERFRAAGKHRPRWMRWSSEDAKNLVRLLLSIPRPSNASVGYAASRLAVERVVLGFADAIETLEDRVEALALGARASDYHWFRRRFPRAELWVDGWHVDPAPAPPSAAEFAHAQQFVVTTALHWQQFPAAPAADVEGDWRQLRWGNEGATEANEPHLDAPPEPTA